MDNKINIGIDLGGSHIAIGAVNDKGELVEILEKYFTLEEKKNLIQVAVHFIIDAINELKQKYSFSKIGMGIAGTISNGVILKSVNLGIENYNIKEILEKETGLEVIVKNDAKCAAISEYRFGCCTQYKNVLFLTLGTGIGGSYIYQGKLMEGSVFEGLEVGHMVIRKDGLECNCGKKGCFEKYASLLVFKRKIIERLDLPYNSNGDTIRHAMQEEKEKIKDIKDEYINNLALGLSNLINIFEPDAVVIGGGFAKYDYLLLDELKEKLLNSTLLFNSRKDIAIMSAKLRNDAGIIGASML